jgi:hypothetical protein
MASASRRTGLLPVLMLALSNMAWLEKNAWKDYCEYEAQLNRS